jgi:tetratricopeptide (TPR) repeat protein
LVIPSQPCDQCGALNPVTARFCNYCGQSVTFTAIAAPSSPEPVSAQQPVTSGQRLEMPGGLFHAVLAIDWVDWKTLSDQEKQQCQAIIQQKSLVFGAQLDRQTGGYQFLRVTHTPDAPTCADTVIQLALAIRRAVVQHAAINPGVAPLRCKLGADMEPADDKNPLCAIAQRVGAPVNRIVLSQRVQDSVLTHYPTRPADHGVELLEPGERAASAGEAPFLSAPADLPADSLPAAESQGDALMPPVGQEDASTLAEQTMAHVPDDPLATPPDTDESQDTPDLVAPQPTDMAYQPAPSIPPSLDLTALEHQAIPQYWVPASSAMPLTDSTLQQVSDQLRALCRNHLNGQTAGQLVVFTGHEGSGKTRLVQNIVQEVVQGMPTEDVPCFWLHGQSGPPFSPLALWQNVISRFYHITPLGLPLDQLQTLFAEQAFPHDAFNAQWQQLIGHWFGCLPLQSLDASYTVQPRLLASMLMAFFQLISQHRPVILMLDDLEEADPASLDLLIELLTMGLCHALPVLVVVTFNQDVTPTGALADAFKTGINLNLPLLQGEALTTYLQEGPLNAVWGQFPPHLLEQITTLSQGNPLIIEECLRLLFLKGALHPLTGPSITLTAADPMAVFMERFDLLPEPDQQVAQWFSVIGQPVVPDAFAMLSGISNAADSLNTLKEHGILVEDPSTGLTFRHRLLQQWVYQSLPEATRLQWHTQLAETLDNLTESRQCVPYAFLAEQAELANELELAAHAWSASGVWAAGLHNLTGFNMAMIRAAQLFNMVLSQPAPHNPASIASALNLVTQYLAQLNAHDQPHITASVMADEPAAESDKLHQLLTRVTSQEAMGQFAEGLPILENTLLTLAGTPDTEQEQLYLQTQQAKWHVALGLLPQADDLLKQHVLPRLGETSTHPLHTLSWMDAYSSKVTLQLLACRADVFDTLDLMMSHPYLAHPPISWQLLMASIYRRQGHYTRAQDMLLAIQATDPGDVQTWHIEQAMLYNDLGQFEKSLGTCQIAFGLPLANQWQRVQLMVAQGHALLGAQKWEAASQVIKQAVAFAMDGQYRLQLWDAKVLWCEALIKTSQVDTAAQQLQALWQQALPAAYQYKVAALLAQALLKQGKTLDAGRLLEPLWKTVTDSRQLPLIAAMAEQVGRFYLALSRQSETPKAQIQTGVQFLQRAQRLWEQMHNTHHVNRLKKVLSK